jgi:hypothetical protein
MEYMNTLSSETSVFFPHKVSWSMSWFSFFTASIKVQVPQGLLHYKHRSCCREAALVSTLLNHLTFLAQFTVYLLFFNMKLLKDPLHLLPYIPLPESVQSN